MFRVAGPRVARLLSGFGILSNPKTLNLIHLPFRVQDLGFRV